MFRSISRIISALERLATAADDLAALTAADLGRLRPSEAPPPRTFYENTTKIGPKEPPVPPDHDESGLAAIDDAESWAQGRPNPAFGADVHDLAPIPSRFLSTDEEMGQK